MALGFFSKTESRVLTAEGPRGGVDVIFEVKELPIIRDLQFKGMHSITESEVLKAFRHDWKVKTAKRKFLRTRAFVDSFVKEILRLASAVAARTTVATMFAPHL